MADDKKLKIGIEIDAETRGATEAVDAIERVEDAISGSTDAANNAATAQNTMADGMEDAGDAAAAAATKVAAAEAKMEAAGSAGDAAAPRTRNMGNALLQLSRAADDAQYGVAGVVNNIEGIAMALGVGGGVAGVATVAAISLNQLFKYFAEDSAEAKKQAEELAEKMQEKAEDLKASLQDAAKASAAAQKAEWEDLLAESGRAYDAAVRNAAALTAEVQRTIDKLAEQRERMADISTAQASLEKAAISASGMSDSAKIMATAQIDKAALQAKAQEAADKLADELDTLAAALAQAKSDRDEAAKRMQTADNRLATAKEAQAEYEEAAAAAAKSFSESEKLKADAAKAAEEKWSAASVPVDVKDDGSGTSYAAMLSGGSDAFISSGDGNGGSKAESLKAAAQAAQAETEKLQAALAEAKARTEQFPISAATQEQNTAADALKTAADNLEATAKKYQDAQATYNERVAAINAVLQRNTATVDIEAADASFKDQIKDPVAAVSTALGNQTAEVKASFETMKSLLEGGVTAAEQTEFRAAVKRLEDAIGTGNKNASDALDKVVKLGTAQGTYMENIGRQVESLKAQQEKQGKATIEAFESVKNTATAITSQLNAFKAEMNAKFNYLDQKN